MQYRGASRSAHERSAADRSRRGGYLSVGARRAAPGAASLLLLLAIGCARAPAAREEAPLETVDVAETVDSQIRPEDDVRAEVRVQGLVGVLPGGYPADSWVYRPASIVDFGSADGGREYVNLRTVGKPSVVAGRWLSEQRARGWEASGEGSSILSFTKGGRRIDVALESKGNETWMRIDYPPM